jgi:hypothetical protein
MQTIKGIELDRFAVAYITCALWASIGNNDQPLDKTFAPYHLSPETLQQIKADCTDFQETARALLDQSGLSPERAGHDFFLTRNRHGAGFWDEGLGKIGQQLTDIAHPYGSFDLYVGDDGNLYGS